MYKIQMGPGNHVHIRGCSHLWSVHSQRFHCMFGSYIFQGKQNILQNMISEHQFSF